MTILYVLCNDSVADNPCRLRAILSLHIVGDGLAAISR